MKRCRRVNMHTRRGGKPQNTWHSSGHRKFREAFYSWWTMTQRSHIGRVALEGGALPPNSTCRNTVTLTLTTGFYARRCVNEDSCAR